MLSCPVICWVFAIDPDCREALVPVNPSLDEVSVELADVLGWLLELGEELMLPEALPRVDPVVPTEVLEPSGDDDEVGGMIPGVPIELCVPLEVAVEPLVVDELPDAELLGCVDVVLLVPKSPLEDVVPDCDAVLEPGCTALEEEEEVLGCALEDAVEPRVVPAGCELLVLEVCA